MTNRLVELDDREQKIVFAWAVYQVESWIDSCTDDELREDDTWGIFMEAHHIINLMVTVGGQEEPKTGAYSRARQWYHEEMAQQYANAGEFDIAKKVRDIGRKD